MAAPADILEGIQESRAPYKHSCLKQLLPQAKTKPVPTPWNPLPQHTVSIKAVATHVTAQRKNRTSADRSSPFPGLG